MLCAQSEAQQGLAWQPQRPRLRLVPAAAPVVALVLPAQAQEQRQPPPSLGWAQAARPPSWQRQAAPPPRQRQAARPPLSKWQAGLRPPSLTQLEQRRSPTYSFLRGITFWPAVGVFFLAFLVYGLVCVHNHAPVTVSRKDQERERNPTRHARKHGSFTHKRGVKREHSARLRSRRGRSSATARASLKCAAAIYAQSVPLVRDERPAQARLQRDGGTAHCVDRPTKGGGRRRHCASAGGAHARWTHWMQDCDRSLCGAAPLAAATQSHRYDFVL